MVQLVMVLIVLMVLKVMIWLVMVLIVLAVQVIMIQLVRVLIALVIHDSVCHGIELISPVPSENNTILFLYTIAEI